MGNTNQASQLHNETRLAASKFDEDQLHILKATWLDLAERNQGKGIDKDTFQQYFPLSGLLGDRLFAQFDVKGNGLIDFDEFVQGLAVCSRGTPDEKIRFVFNMYDTSRNGTVSKAELTTLLNHIPKFILDSVPRQEHHHDTASVASTVSEIKTPDIHTTGTEGQLTPVPDYEDYEEEVDAYTNHDLVERAFEECDLNHEGRLTYEQFKMWVERTPVIIAYFESILPFVGNKNQELHHTQKNALPLAPARINSGVNIARNTSGTLVLNGETNGRISRQISGQLTRPPSVPISRTRTPTTESLIATVRHKESNVGPSPGIGLGLPLAPVRNSSFQIGLPHGIGAPTMTAEGDTVDSEEYCRQLLTQALELTQNESLRMSLQEIIDTEFGSNNIEFARLTTAEIYKDIVKKEGYLWKRGNMLHLWSKRWYLLSGNCIYYYAHQRDVRPRGVIFLTGCIIEKIHDEVSEVKGYFGIELIHQDLCTGEHYKHEIRQLFCKSEYEREQWLSALQHAAEVVPIEEDYVIGKELGRGRFSRVCECVNKVTGIRYAVKIIEKATIEPDEKALLRTEIAVLKLVNHPNIIKMQGVYESRSHIYIVMEKLVGGELFERIVGRPRFSEDEAAKLIRPLLESVAYLHDLGIVHRDIKPENILCGENLEDIKIADFGLSKMLLPKERMDTACGTLSYVAPEVLTMTGYGQEADLWSVGVILFLVLCGKLPFDGATHDDIIRNTVQGEFKVSPTIWNKISPEAQSLIKALLQKNPKDRISARAALKHPFLAIRKVNHSVVSSDENSSVSSGKSAVTH